MYKKKKKKKKYFLQKLKYQLSQKQHFATCAGRIFVALTQFLKVNST